MRITWDEAKRERNLDKHGLDFADAHWVLESPYRLDVPVARAGEARIQSFAYVFEVLTVLSLAYVARDEQIRIISFRKASAQEREVYHEWLATEAE
ncbi:MAG: BrnT family toxin [Nitrococcus sp.]|nr:BrnT family toxin [Nitrococcus sp.]